LGQISQTYIYPEFFFLHIMIGIPSLLATRNKPTTLFNSESFQRDLNIIERNPTLSPTEMTKAVIALVVSFYNPPSSKFTIKSAFMSLPFELTLVVFTNLDLQDLLVCMRTCNLWKQLISTFSETLWRNLLMRDYQIRNTSERLSFKETYRLSFNVARERYSFAALEEGSSGSLQSLGENIVASWSVNPNQAVISFFLFTI
jgi:hypothetical protein